MKFYNRETELAFLRSFSVPRIVVLGRRRVGKTRLVNEAYGKECIALFISADKSEKELINGWREEHPELEIPEFIRIIDLVKYLINVSPGSVIFIDEIQNIYKINKAFLYDLQRLLDQRKDARIVVCGSYLSLLKKIIERQAAPLYGRFDAILKIDELPLSTTAEISRDLGYSFEDGLKIRMVFGGLPKYYELFEKIKRKKIEEHLLDLFVRYPRPLHRELKAMLGEEFGGGYRIYFSILSAMGRGNPTLGEISNKVGRPQTKITKYISLLSDDFEIIQRILSPVGDKRGRYRIKSNFVFFWFSLLSDLEYYFEQNLEAVAEEKFLNRLSNYWGFGFERIVHEAFPMLSPFKIDKMGSHWGKIPGAQKGENTYEIDLVALNENEREILFGECKWQDGIDGNEIMAELRKKAGYVDWHKDDREEYYYIFGKSFRRKTEGDNVRFVDLKALEEVLKKRSYLPSNNTF